MWSGRGGTGRRRTLRALILAAGLAAAAAPALAEDRPAGAIDPERLALAREYIRESHIDAAMRGMFANMAKSMPPLSTDSAEDVKARQFLNSISVGMDAALPQLMDATARATARVFTTQELKDLVAFYATPTGRSMVAKMPAMMEQVVPSALDIMQSVYVTAEGDYCRHQTCTEADHARFRRMQSALRASPRPPPAAE